MECVLSQLWYQCFSKFINSNALSNRSCSHYRLRSVVLKNLNSHSGRNVKTSIMFITTLAFCIFAGVSNSFLTNSAVDFFAWLTGSDFEVYAFWQKNALPIDELSVWLDKQKKLGKIDDYTSITFPISWYSNDEFWVDEISVSSLAGTPQLSQWIVGCQENYLNVMWDKFLDIQEIGNYHNGSIPKLANGNDDDVIKILYTDAGRATLNFEENGIEVPPPILSGRYWTYEEQTGNEQKVHSFASKNENIDKIINELNSSYYEYIDIVVSTSLVSALGINIDDPLVLDIGVYDSNYKYYEFQYLMKIRAILNKIPGLVMLPYDLQYASFLAEFQNAIMPAYNKIFKDITDYIGVDVATSIYQKVAIMPSDATDNDYIY